MWRCELPCVSGQRRGEGARFSFVGCGCPPGCGAVAFVTGWLGPVGWCGAAAMRARKTNTINPLFLSLRRRSGAAGRVGLRPAAFGVLRLDTYNF